MGVLLGLLLVRRGLDVTVLERAHDVHPLPRAVAADPAVQQALADAGLADAVGRLTVLDGVRLDRTPGAADPLLHLHPPALGVWPGLATYAQPDLEAALREALGHADPEALATGADVLSVSPRADAPGAAGAAVLHVRDDDGEHLLHARAVVAADGAHSQLRAAAGVRLRRLRGRHRWTVLDLALPRPLGRRSLTFTLEPRRPCVDLPVPGGHRVEALLDPGEPDDVLTGPGRDDLLHRLLGPDGVPGPRGAPGARLLRASTYTFTTGVAARRRAGPLLLVGDAAHQVPPFLGQGLALGIGDVVGLAWRLAAVLTGRADVRALDVWGDERGRAATAAAARSRAAGVLLQTRRGALVRDALLRAAGAAPVTGPWLTAGGPRPPVRRLLPDVALEDPAGRLGEVLGDGWVTVRRPAGRVLEVRVRGGGRGAGPSERRARVRPEGASDLDPVLPVGHVALVRPDRVAVGALPDDAGADGRLRRLASSQGVAP